MAVWSRKKVVAETLEFSATDAVLGRLESRTQRRNVVYVLVDAVLQDQKMITGARVEFLMCEPVLALKDGEPRRKR
jgi:hypothetical protein